MTQTKRAAWLAPTLLLLAAGGAVAQGAGSAPKTQASFTAKVSTAPAKIKHGSAATLSVSLADTGPSVSKAVVDIEVYNAKGVRVGQNAWQGVTLAHGKPSAYHWSWKPAQAGAYTVKVGVFGAGWKPLLHWNDQALKVTVS